MQTKSILMLGNLKLVFFNYEKNQTVSDLTLHAKILCPTDSMKYLGIIFDENLTWHQHINNVYNKTSCRFLNT